MWQVNIPHTHLAHEKSDQNWMVVKGDKIAFPGGGTHFHYGADKYIALLANVSLVCLHRNSIWEVSTFLAFYYILILIITFYIYFKYAYVYNLGLLNLLIAGQCIFHVCCAFLPLLYVYSGWQNKQTCSCLD